MKFTLHTVHALFIKGNKVCIYHRILVTSLTLNNILKTGKLLT